MNIKRKLERLCWLEFIWHRPFKLEAVWELLAHVATLRSRGAIVWEVRGYRGHVRYLLGVEQRHIGKLEEACRAHGNIQIHEISNSLEDTRKPVVMAKQLKITKPVLSLNTDIAMSVIRAGLAAIATAHRDEETVLQIVLGGAFAPSSVPANMSDPNTNWLHWVLGNVRQATPESRSSAKEKAGQHGFYAVIRLGIAGAEYVNRASNTERISQAKQKNSANRVNHAHNVSRINSIYSALKTLESVGVRIRTLDENPERVDLAHVPWHFPLRLSVKELANFLLLPVGEEELAGTKGIHPRLSLPPIWYKEPTFAGMNELSP